MDWVWIAALVWVVLALPLALMTGRYLRRSDEWNAASAGPGNSRPQRSERLPQGPPTVVASRNVRRRINGLRTASPAIRSLPPARCAYRLQPGDREGRREDSGAPTPPSITDPRSTQPPSRMQGPIAGRAAAKPPGEPRSRSMLYRHR